MGKELEQQEIKLMVDLVKSESPLISPEEINYKICELWEIFVPLHKIYSALGVEFNEDFELESNQIKYYGDIYGRND
jgi:hypothetical protein